jgi:predicted RNA binding protein YcfA (HicA-like mRNA interferase family)
MRGYTAKDINDILTQHGWQYRGTRGSHITYFKAGISNIVTVPSHNGELCRPLTRRLLREAGILN